eukprot:23535_6
MLSASIIAPNVIHLYRLEWCMPNIARTGSTFGSGYNVPHPVLAPFLPSILLSYPTTSSLCQCSSFGFTRSYCRNFSLS